MTLTWLPPGFGQGDTLALAIALVALAFLGAGVVKGLTGTGIPMVAVPILASTLPPATAIALTAIPVLGSNIMQALQGGHLRHVSRRFWTLLLAMGLATAFAAHWMARLPAASVSLVLGVIVLIFGVLRAFPLRMSVPPRHERATGVAVGIGAGMLGGISGLHGPLAIMYLMALRLEKNLFVAAIALFYLVGGAPLYATLAVNRVLSAGEFWVSLLACVPLLAGIAVGTVLRARMSQTAFQRALTVVLLLAGLNLIWKGLR